MPIARRDLIVVEGDNGLDVCGEGKAARQWCCVNGIGERRFINNTKE